jgi:hypothetical protein
MRVGECCCYRGSCLVYTAANRCADDQTRLGVCIPNATQLCHGLAHVAARNAAPPTGAATRSATAASARSHVRQNQQVAPNPVSAR